MIPALAFVAFQAMFAIITVALITGAIADRAKFSTWMVFTVVWATIVYFPVAHWVFAFAATRPTRAAGSPTSWSAIDFAGGTAVHINAGAAGLALALVLGKRIGFGKEPDAPAQPAAGHARRRPAVVRLVRLQRRLGARRQRHRRHRLGQHATPRPPPRCSAGWSPRRSATVTPPPSARPPAWSPAWSPSPRPAASVTPIGAIVARPRRRRGLRPRGRAEVPVRLRRRARRRRRPPRRRSRSAPCSSASWRRASAPAGVDGLFYGGGLDQLWRRPSARGRRVAGVLLRRDLHHRRLVGCTRRSACGSARTSRLPASTCNLHAETRTTSLAGGGRIGSAPSAPPRDRRPGVLGPNTAGRERRHEARHRDHQAAQARRGEGRPWRPSGSTGMTVSEASGYGRQRGPHRGLPRRRVHRRPGPEGPARGAGRRLRLRATSSTSSSRPRRPAGSATARSGRVPVDDVVRVRTGERGLDAL